MILRRTGCLSPGPEAEVEVERRIEKGTKRGKSDMASMDPALCHRSPYEGGLFGICSHASPTATSPSCL